MRALYLCARVFRDVPQVAQLYEELLPAMNARQNEELRLPGWGGVTVCAKCRWQWRGPVADHKPGCPFSYEATQDNKASTARLELL